MTARVTVAVLGAASTAPSFAAGGRERRDMRSGGWGAEPNTEPVVLPVSRELGRVIAAAHVAWARRHAPHLLQDWLR